MERANYRGDKDDDDDNDDVDRGGNGGRRIRWGCTDVDIRIEWNTDR